tara:strand:- start:39693 stop:40097 length:405 start_codon:yes stop_codon:yes gene_type:complete
VSNPKHKVIKALDQPKIEVDRGAHKLDKWLDRQRGIIEQAGVDHKAANPDRYFVAFVRLDMPRSTAPERVWPRSINETFLFEQPDMPSLDDVVATAKKAWGIADRVEVLNFYEMNEVDYMAFLGDESGWTVIHE